MPTRLSRVAVAGLLAAASLGTASVVEAGCTRPDHIVYFDPKFNTQIDIAPATGDIVFQTGDRQTLTATGAKVTDDGRHLTARYAAARLNIEARADLPVGRIRAKVVEIRDPLPDPRPPIPGAIKRKPRPYSKIWTVTLFGGRSQEGQCGVGFGPGSPGGP